MHWSHYSVGGPMDWFKIRTLKPVHWCEFVLLILPAILVYTPVLTMLRLSGMLRTTEIWDGVMAAALCGLASLLVSFFLVPNALPKGVRVWLIAGMFTGICMASIGLLFLLCGNKAFGNIWFDALVYSLVAVTLAAILESVRWMRSLWMSD